MLTHQGSFEYQLEEPRHLAVLAGSTPVIFRGPFRTARVATVGSNHLEIIHLSGRTVCEAVATFIPLTSRPAHSRGQGPQRSFFWEFMAPRWFPVAPPTSRRSG